MIQADKMTKNPTGLRPLEPVKLDKLRLVHIRNDKICTFLCDDKLGNFPQNEKYWGQRNIAKWLPTPID